MTMRVRPSVALVALGVLSACGTAGPASLEFVEINPKEPRIGDVVTVRFRVWDERGNPLAGQKVDFSLQQDKAGVTLDPPSVTSIKGSGFAETQIVASARVNSVIIVAKSGTKQILSPPITFAGSVPNWRQLTFQCGPIAGAASGGRHAIGTYDQTRNLIAGIQLECSAHVADRNGDGVPNALVSFMTEAGAISPTEISQTNAVGDATVLHVTTYPTPQDTEPTRWNWTPLADATHTGEYVAPLWMEPFMWVPNPAQVPRPPPGNNPQEPSRTDPLRRKPDGSTYKNNPRDNLVTMIAVTAGEEGFTDLNNNGVWDQGEPFEDLTEPFVDANDNGTYDADPACLSQTDRTSCGEKFIDLNGNKQWDGKNGKWDSDTLIWTSERILWTGVPHYLDSLSPQPLLTPIQPATIALLCPVGSPTCAQAGPPVVVAAVLADPWYNSMAQNGEGDGCSIPALEESPIKTTPNVVNQGIKYTYPAGDLIQFMIRDARNPGAKPDEQIPKRVPAISFVQPIQCLFTASPKEGNVLILTIGTVAGTIE